MTLEMPNPKDYSSDYKGYCKYLNDKGYVNENIFIDELSTNYVLMHGVRSGTTGNVIEIVVPRGQKISVMGTQQLRKGQDGKEAYPLMVRLADKDDNEVHSCTKMRIVKTCTMSSVTNLARVFYADINMIKGGGGSGDGSDCSCSNSIKFKTENEWYRFKGGFELSGGQSFGIDALNNVMSSRDIDSEHIKFSLQADIWTMDG
jgi:hypothetical protein